MDGKETILIIEKDKKHRKYLKRILDAEGYNIISTEKSMEGFEELESEDVDLIVSDYYLKDIRGKRFYKQVSNIFKDIPIIFLSNRADADTIREILEYPNADYMVKPVVVEELLARIIKFLKTEGQNNKKKLRIGDLVINTDTYKAKRGDKPLELSPTEFKLLRYLMQNKDIVLSRRMILNKVWGYSYDVSSRIVDVYIGYLREKIDKDTDVKLIQTVPGFGYRIRNPDLRKQEESKDQRSES